MKPFTYLNDDLVNKINVINTEMSARKANNNINYMEIKECSEKMEKARTQAQYEILRFKYEILGEKKNPQDLRQAINEYKIMKATYFGLYHAYLTQCQSKIANDKVTPLRRRAA